MKIIGITWPAAAWKGTVVDYLVNQCWFVHYSVSGYLKDQLVAMGKEVNRDTLKWLADDLRKKHDSGYLIWELYRMAEKWGKNAIIESIRTVWEVELLKKKTNFILLSIDADQELRYQRALSRNSEKDHISFEKFKQQDEAESVNEDPTKGNILACQKLADVSLVNQWDKELLFQEIQNKIVPLL